VLQPAPGLAIPLAQAAARSLAGLRAGWEAVPPALLPVLVFVLRTTDLTLSTVRMLAVVRGRRLAAWILGFAQALVFISAVAGVLSRLDDPWNWIAYAAGFGTGNVVGILLESRLAPGHSLLQVVSPRRGQAVTEALRRAGRGVTTLAARGLGGAVSLLLCYVPRRDVEDARREILGADPEAYITVGHVRQVRGGWRA
jgi:uncharacterized protein YebE (UPF0316 family)